MERRQTIYNNKIITLKRNRCLCLAIWLRFMGGIAREWRKSSKARKQLLKESYENQMVWTCEWGVTETKNRPAKRCREDQDCTLDWYGLVFLSNFLNRDLRRRVGKPKDTWRHTLTREIKSEEPAGRRCEAESGGQRNMEKFCRWHMGHLRPVKE